MADSPHNPQIIPNAAQDRFVDVVMGLGDIALDTTLEVVRVGDGKTPGGIILSNAERVVLELSLNSDVPYRATLSEAINDFPTGKYFKSDDKLGEGEKAGTLWIYQRVDVQPFYEAKIAGSISIDGLTQAVAAAVAGGITSLVAIQEATAAIRDATALTLIDTQNVRDQTQAVLNQTVVIRDATDLIRAQTEIAKSQAIAATAIAPGNIQFTASTPTVPPAQVANGAGYWAVVDGGDYLQAYINNAGVGAIVSGVRSPLGGVIDRLGLLDPVEYNRSGYRYAILDQDGRILFSIPKNGIPTIEATSLFAGGQKVVYLDTVEYNRSGYANVILDQDNRVLSGTLKRKPAAAVVVPIYANGLTTGGQVIDFLDPIEFGRSGYYSVLVDGDGRILDGVKRRTDPPVVPVAALDTLYELAELTDSAGKVQTYLSKRATGKLLQVSPAGSNNAPRAMRSDGTLTYKSDRAINPAPGALYTRRFDRTTGLLTPETQVFPSREFGAWGDSLTEQGFADGTQYATLAAAALGWTSVSYGISGQQPRQIGARAGGIPLIVTLTGNILPASGSVVLTAINDNPITGQRHIKLHGRFGLNGPYGIIQRNGDEGSSSSYIGTQDAGGVDTVIAPGTRFYPDGANLNQTTSVIVPYNRNAVQLIRTGRNGVDQIGTNLAVIQSIIDLQPTLNKRFLIPSIVPFNDPADPLAANGYAEGYGTSGRSVLDAHNAAIAAAWPDNFVDLLPAMLAAGDGSAGDNADIAAGMTPRSLRAYSGGGYDYGHPQASGRAVNSATIVAATNARGWN